MYLQANPLVNQQVALLVLLVSLLANLPILHLCQVWCLRQYLLDNLLVIRAVNQLANPQDSHLVNHRVNLHHNLPVNHLDSLHHNLQDNLHHNLQDNLHHNLHHNLLDNLRVNQLLNHQLFQP